VNHGPATPRSRFTRGRRIPSVVLDGAEPSEVGTQVRAAAHEQVLSGPTEAVTGPIARPVSAPKPAICAYCAAPVPTELLALAHRGCGSLFVPCSWCGRRTAIGAPLRQDPTVLSRHAVDAA